ncbi:hypothetical protein AB1Y20_017685 [Prymnesium parvum]|uniref:Uncharacterized protein n=1 Tax=Prymnesium parvum TaxID=97485 RepID=A0AB34JMG3_PRYPA
MPPTAIRPQASAPVAVGRGTVRSRGGELPSPSPGPELTPPAPARRSSPARPPARAVRRTPMEKEEAARRGLLALLGYCKDLCEEHHKNDPPTLQLSGQVGGDDGALVLYEPALRRLQELKRADGSPVMWLASDDPLVSKSEGESAVWMRLHRPDVEEARRTPLGQQACAVYASLFTAHQEAVREGRGAQLTVGVGLVRWKVDATLSVDHPLVTLPADVQLDEKGALIVRMADAAQAVLWPFPGVRAAQAAQGQIDECARAYGLLGGAPPPPTAREVWEPLFTRAAHTLSANGVYVPTPPKCNAKGALPPLADGGPFVHNSFVLWARHGLAEHSTAADAAAMERAVHALPLGAMPPALARLAGVFGLPRPPPAAPPPAGLLGTLKSVFRLQSKADDGAPFLYFGLPSNMQQESVVSTLQEHGCAVLVGPPGTGKSQTIANVICHYLATGRRVLVTSKGEPATEVLRMKLPAGVRELCVSLGAGDSSSFRRLEAAVENLADNVAGTPASHLAATVERLRRHVAALTAEVGEVEAAEEAWAAPHFPPPPRWQGAPSEPRKPIPDGPEEGPLRGLALHAAHVEALGITSAATATLTSLADAVCLALDREEARPAVGAAEARGFGVPGGAPAFFLSDVDIDPQRPPPAQALVDDIRELRRRCMVCLRWGEAHLRLRTPRAEEISSTDVSALATQLREKMTILEEVEGGQLPHVCNQLEAVTLLHKLKELCVRMRALHACAAPHGERWLFALLRLAHSELARRTLREVAMSATRLSELGLRVEKAEVVTIPEKLLKAFDTFPLTRAQAAAEVSAEVSWRAHPSQRSWLTRFQRHFMGTRGGQTLQVALEDVLVDGKKPVTEHEWTLVESLLELRTAAASFRAAWAKLDDFATPPPLPTSLQRGRHDEAADLAAWVRTRHLDALLACDECAAAVRGLADVAARAIADTSRGRPSPPAGSLDPLLAEALQGAVECDAAVSKLNRALHTFDPDVQTAERQHAEMLREFDRVNVTSGEYDASPLGKLRRACAMLGSPSVSTDEAVTAFLTARAELNEARESLVHLPRLRTLVSKLQAPGWATYILRPDPLTATGATAEACPSDAPRLWSALAVLRVLRRAEQRTPAAARGISASTQRLIEEREVAVCDLVAAAAKHALRSAMSPELCASLMRLVSAVGQARSTSDDSVRSARYRGDLAAALADCSSSIPCWIMPTWRISQSLPAEVGAFDLVILDEASQSDITALPALLRGKQLLIVGDGKQVSPTCAFVAESRISDLKASLRTRHYPFVEQLLPGRSMFDLAQICFADTRVSLYNHFRCVPAIIAFSNENFYHSRLQPRRLPPRSQRLDPAVVDVLVPGGARRGKINMVEAKALVNYLAKGLAEGGEFQHASVGIISLGGVEQVRLLRSLVLEVLSDIQLAKHRVVVGDPTSFQGDERDLILLSMVQSSGQAAPQVGKMYEQRYNVALSRARDRMVLFRSLRAADISNPDDLKLKTIQFFSRGGGPNVGAIPVAEERERSAARGKTAEAELCAFLERNGYKYSNHCSIGGSAAVAEDGAEDRRLCICLDGGMGGTISDWRQQVREQRALHRAGWRFHRIWRASWLVDRSRCEAELRAALDAASVHPVNHATSAQPTPPTEKSPNMKARLTEARPQVAAPLAGPATGQSSGGGGGSTVSHVAERDAVSKRKASEALDTTAAAASPGSKRKAPAKVAEGKALAVQEGGDAASAIPPPSVGRAVPAAAGRAASSASADGGGACTASASASQPAAVATGPKKRATPSNPPASKKKKQDKDDPDYEP